MEIKIPVNIHLICDPENGFTTSRTEEGIKDIFKEVNRIWAPAEITFEISNLQSETISPEKIMKLLDKMKVEEPSNTSNQIDVYFLNNFQLVPGINLGYSRRELRRIFIVDDLRRINDFRCLAHEFGHILRLNHVPQLDRLMEQAGNKEKLTDWEIEIARHMATMRS